MMNLNHLTEKTKIVKLHDALKAAFEKEPKLKNELLELNIGDENEVHGFCKRVFGEPKGIWKNNIQEQAKLLRRYYDDYHRESGSYMRPDWSGDHGTF